MDAELEEQKEWIRIRKNLNQKYKYDKAWNEAIELFNKRLKRKFFDPLQSIIDGRVLKGEGFTIVTVQCALIEMFAAFRAGKIFNHNKTATSPNYEYKESQKMFCSLLRTASIFQDNFWELNKKNKKVIDSPYSASEFYKSVRCGLMHEARTKGNWHITATPPSKSVKTEKQFIVTEGNKIKIYRTVLHYKLLAYLAEYSTELRENTKAGETLRKYFARKLDHLFNIMPDTNYDWWIE